MTTINPTSGGPPDRVAVAPRAAHFSETVAGVGRSRAGRLEALQAKIASGTYDIPPERVADAILASVRGSGRSAYEAAGAAARHRIR